MIIYYQLLTFITVTFISLDTFFYPTFGMQHFMMDAGLIFAYYIGTACVLAGRKELTLPQQLETINRKILFPLLMIVAFLLLLIERLTYNNFVFTHFHLHPILFIYFPILSGIIIVIPHFKVKGVERVFFLIPPIFFFILYILSLTWQDLFLNIIQEDHLLEYLQFLFCFATSIYSFRVFMKLKKHKQYLEALLFLAFSIGMFFVAGEEISWGQRILGIQTPFALKGVNVQNEITVHNLKPFHYLLPVVYICIGLYGAFSRYILEKFFHSYKHFTFFTPSYFLFFPFFLIALFYYQNIFGIYTYAGIPDFFHNIYPQNWQEAMETFLAFGFFGYAYYTFHTKKP